MCTSIYLLKTFFIGTIGEKVLPQSRTCLGPAASYRPFSLRAPGQPHGPDPTCLLQLRPVLTGSHSAKVHFCRAFLDSLPFDPGTFPRVILGVAVDPALPLPTSDSLVGLPAGLCLTQLSAGAPRASAHAVPSATETSALANDRTPPSGSPSFILPLVPSFCPLRFC